MNFYEFLMIYQSKDSKVKKNYKSTLMLLNFFLQI